MIQDKCWRAQKIHRYAWARTQTCRTWLLSYFICLSKAVAIRRGTRWSMTGVFGCTPRTIQITKSRTNPCFVKWMVARQLCLGPSYCVPPFTITRTYTTWDLRLPAGFWVTNTSSHNPRIIAIRALQTYCTENSKTVAKIVNTKLKVKKLNRHPQLSEKKRQNTLYGALLSWGPISIQGALSFDVARHMNKSRQIKNQSYYCHTCAYQKSCQDTALQIRIESFFLTMRTVPSILAL